MIRLIFYFILLLAVVGGLGWGISQGTGYVLITFDQFRYESTLWVFLGLLFGLWLALFLLRRILKLLVVSGAVINPWSRRNRERRVRKAILAGQRELAEGRWSQALEHLTLAADNDTRPLVHYLGAARAANEIGKPDECDRLLARALNREPESALAVGLTRAQLLIERGDLSSARDSLSDLQREFPKHPQVLSLVHKLYLQLEDWEQLSKLLPELRRQKILSDVKLGDLEHLVWRSLLLQGAKHSANPEVQLTQYWQDMPVRLHSEASIVHAYASALIQIQQPEKALSVLTEALNQHKDSSLIELYGQVQASESMQQLLTAEQWQGDSNDSVLLLTLGRLSARNGLWDKARSYLEDSLRLAHRPETCAELARVMIQLGDQERGNQLFIESLAAQDRSLPVPQ